MSKKKGKNPDCPDHQEEVDLATDAAASQAGAPAGAEPAAEQAAQPEVNPLEDALAAEKERYLRLAAEFDNYRKRSQKEREFIFADVRADTVLRFLPVYDNLERALKQETTDAAYRKGVELTMAQFREVLEKLGVSEIPTLGQTFDPNLHNAVMHIEDESYGAGEIVEEFQKGFILGDKVIRFSMVKVAN